MTITRDYDDMQLNKIKEMVDIGNAAAADSLKKIIGQNVAIPADKANGVYFNQLDVSDIVPCIAVNISTSGAVHGKCLLLVSINNANKIINVLMNTDAEEADLLADEIRSSALTELFNQLISVFTRTLSSLWNEEITFVQTDIKMYDANKSLADICGFNTDEQFVYLTNMLSVQGMSSSTVYMLFNNELAASYLKKLCEGYEEEPVTEQKNNDEKDDNISQGTPDKENSQNRQMLQSDIENMFASLNGSAESNEPEPEKPEPVVSTAENRQMSQSDIENMFASLNGSAESNEPEPEKPEPVVSTAENRQMSQGDIENMFASLSRSAEGKDNIPSKPAATANISPDYENQNNADVYNKKTVPQPVNNFTETGFEFNNNSYDSQKNETAYGTERYIQYKQELRKSKEKLINVKEAQFPSFDDANNSSVDQSSNTNVEVLMDVPLNVRVEIGKAKKTMSEIMRFAQGTIITLEKQAGAPVDVIANNQVIAHGDIIVVDDNFGVRITEIVSKKKYNAIKK